MKHFKGIIATSKDLGDGVMEAVVATEDEDRDGEVLSMKGLDVSKFKKNPVVLWAHQYDKPPIGRAESISKKEDGSLVAKIKFAITESDFAREVHALYKGGFLNAFSIGFMPKEIDENTFTKSEMLEFSAVPVPANPNALLAAKGMGLIGDDTLQKLAGQEKSKTITVDVDTLDRYMEAMVSNMEGLAKEIKELKRLDRTGASPRKRRIRLVGVRKRLQSQQTLTQSANRGLAKLKSTRSNRRVVVKLKRED